MKNVREDGAKEGQERSRRVTITGGLATPALSPITEHGDPGIDSVLHNGVEGQYGRGVNTITDKADEGTGQDAEGVGKQDRSKPTSPVSSSTEASKILRLSLAKIHELTHSPSSLPLRAVSAIPEEISPLSDAATSPPDQALEFDGTHGHRAVTVPSLESVPPPTRQNGSTVVPQLASVKTTPGALNSERPKASPRAASSPNVIQRKQSRSKLVENSDQPRSRRPTLAALKIGDQQPQQANGGLKQPTPEPVASPMPNVIPLPPLSLSTYLQLELSPERPSALYIHRPASSDFPYESSRIKFERLLNFLKLPPQLELILWFGALACLDAWLYTFTILPLRFLKAVAMLVQWWAQNAVQEAKELGGFVYNGLGRLWQRQKRGTASVPASRHASVSEAEPPRLHSPEPPMSPPSDSKEGGDTSSGNNQAGRRSRKSSAVHRHRRTRSTPSGLLPNHKADLLHGLLIICSCVILLRFDASRMYHGIRGQAAIKLYVIYNVLEVCDRLFSALGQDILECLFSKETLERKPNGRSKIIRPLWMFVLALVYNVIHAAALFYQVITLNVAVNSYSNALLTLLMSNQFVEIKGTVFKKFEKENLFQLTCADVVERFQLWLMLLIIALRNIVEVGGLSITLAMPSSSATDNFNPNATGAPAFSTGILPRSFTILPKWTGQVLGPFLIVLGSEMLVDWLKHAYINKFNSVKPDIYGRFLDVLAKDYYSHAFADQNLTKRLGLPVLPLACLFIRASVQTYHMFIATHMPLPVPSTATSLSVEPASTATSPATTAALAHIDHIFRRALGRSSFGAGGAPTGPFSWSIDDMIALATMLVFFLVLYLVLLALKLALGMCLLSFARNRYKGMKEREKQLYDTGGRRVGGWGTVEVDEDKRRWIYEGDEDGLRALREREAKNKEKAAKGEIKLDGVGRYVMAAKRIW